MTEIRRAEGYGGLLQCDRVSSSADFYLVTPKNDHFPHRRPSYRKLHFYPQTRFIKPPPIPMSSPPLCSSFPVPCRAGQSFSEITTKWALLSVLGIFVCALLALLAVYMNFPKLAENEIQHMKIPWNLEEAKRLAIVLDHYKKDNYLAVTVGVFVTYIFLQTFAIPGSLFLSILSGFLFPFFQALFLVCTCSAVGASLCFLLSQLLGRHLVLKYFPERANKWAVIVERHSDNLLNYMIFLRITPFLPNWFINLTAPVIGVPLMPFAVGTFLGVAPPSFVAIQAGQTLHTMSATDSAFSVSSFVLLAVFALVSLVPIFLKRHIKEKFQ